MHPSTFMSALQRVAVISVSAVLLASPSRAQAQAPQAPAQPQAAVPAGPLSLVQALELAEARSESIAIARTALTRNDGDRVRARSGRLPQLSAAASYDRSLANEFEGVFDNLNFGGDSSGDSGDGLADLPFGRANTWRATLSFSQNLYSGGRLGAQAALVEVGRTSAEQALTSARAQLLFDVTQAYYDAALTERLVSIAAATLEQAGATLRQTQAGFDAGTQPEFEVLRARVGRDNQMPVLIRQRATREVAFLRLKQLLELPADFDLRLADALDDATLPPAPVFAERVVAAEKSIGAREPISVTFEPGLPMPERNAVAEAQTLVRLREASLKAVEVERKPTLTFTSNYSRIAYPSGAFPSFDRSNWSMGASMSVPILTGGRQRGDEMVARADIEQARIQQRQVEELAALDSQSAWAELIAARAAWQASAGTVQQASRAYDIADVRYRAGVSTQLELADSRLLLQQAEANRAQAARDLQVARARIALLPNLPLGGGTTTQQQRTTQTAPSTQQAQGSTQARSAAAQTGQAGTR